MYIEQHHLFGSDSNDVNHSLTHSLITHGHVPNYYNFYCIFFQIHKILSKINKNECDTEREQSLVDQWVSLTEERNAVLVPAAGSSIPGAPADWNPPSGVETHVPVMFLDLNGKYSIVVVGLHSTCLWYNYVI